MWERGKGRETQENETNSAHPTGPTLSKFQREHEGEQHRGELTIDVIRSEVDLDAERLVGILDGGQGEVRQGLLGKVRHHSL